MEDLTYERLVFGTELKAYPKDLDKAIIRLKEDFNNGRCARGIVLDNDTGKAYVVVDTGRFEDHKKDFDIFEVGSDVGYVNCDSECENV